MAKKAKRKNKKNNNLLVWVFVVLFLLIVLSIAVILTLNNTNNPNNNDKFFTSDSSKYVIASEIGDSDGEDEQITVYDVYYHNDSSITDHRAYYEFDDEEAAKDKLSYFQSLEDDDIQSVEVDGRYIVITANPAQYEKITLEQVKRWSSVNSDED